MVCRLVRISFSVMTVMSLLLCVATAGFWVRSFWVAERCGWATSRAEGPDRLLRDVNIWSARGGVGIYIETYQNLVTDQGKGLPFFHARDAMMEFPYVSPVPAGVTERRWSWAGVAIARSTRGQSLSWSTNGFSFTVADAQTSTSIVMPWCLLSTLSAIIPLIAIRNWYIRRRSRSIAALGLCKHCGYDMRASALRCPECGTAAPAKPLDQSDS